MRAWSRREGRVEDGGGAGDRPREGRVVAGLEVLFREARAAYLSRERCISAGFAVQTRYESRTFCS